MALHITSAGIEFPASQSAQAGGNYLDDYEEGVWTPTLSTSHGSGNGSYGVAIGRYTKIGQHVNAWFWLNLSSVGSMSNYPGITIGTMPFTPKSDASTGSSTTRGGSSYRNPITNTNQHYMFNNDNPASASIAYLYTQTGGIANVATGIYAGFFPYRTT